MKLVIILATIACCYAAKLDRTYLPPDSASTAGGSPGSLTAPTGPNAFGQAAGSGSGPSGFGQTSGSIGQSQSGFGQRPSAFGQAAGKGSGPSGFGQGSGSSGQSGSGFSQGPSAAGQSGPGNYGQAGFGGPSGFAGFGAQGSFDAQGPQANAFSGQNYQQPARAQASAEQGAQILRFDNQNDGETFSYSFETSNGITAEESGVATNGVQAQGGYSYTGDDGQTYRITYTADENGYLPQGDHLPTPPPVPEEILRSLEINAAAAAAGTQEGAYNPDEDNSDNSAGYSQGPASFNQAQGGRPGQQGSYSQGPSGFERTGQGQGTTGQYNQGSAEQGSQYNQGATGQAASGQYGQGPAGQGPSGQYNQGSSGQFNQASSAQGPSGKYNQGSSAQGPSGQYNQQNQGQSFGQNQAQVRGSQAQGDSGYQYNRPQANAQFGSQSGNRPSPGSSAPSGSGFGPQAYNQPGQSGPQGTSGQSRPTGSAGSNGFGGSQSFNQPAARPQTYSQSGSQGPSGPSGASSSGFGGQSFNQAGSGAKQPSGSFARPGQGSFGPQAGGRTQAPVQAPYQYNRPQGGAPFGGSNQAGSPSGPAARGSQGSQGFPGSQGTQGRGQNFGGPRQPPSFSEQEGYKY